MATTKQTTKEETPGGKTGGPLGNLYNEGIQEIVKLAEDDNYAKRVDNGPLKEARGKDTWQVHSQLHSISRLNQNLGSHVGTLESHLNDLDGHLDAATELLSKLTSQTHKETNAALASNLETVGSWITAARKALLEASNGAQKEVVSTVKESFKSLDKNLAEVHETLTGQVSETTTELTQAIGKAQSSINDRLETVHKSMKGAFQELARATAGSEENIRAQTDSFSKAVETLLNDVRGDLDAKIAEFRDDATRLIDKRFNQSDVSFAAVRADQEVIKALLTDIIKDRLGRAEPRVR